MMPFKRYSATCPNFINLFMKRHTQLMVEMANMIQRGRASVSHLQIIDFFNKFEESMEGVLPKNIWNYDKTCMQENPGAIKAIFVRGIMYAE